jgi:hypothetical protein
MSDRRRLVGRDQAASAFTGTLMRLCEVTGASGVALVDFQGETVDYAGSLDPYDIKVAAAEWRLVLRAVHESKVPSWPRTHELAVRGQRTSFLGVSLSDGYAIVLTLPRHCFGVSSRALAEAERELCAEGGLRPSRALERGERWTRVDVRTSNDDPRRPEAVWYGGAWSPVAILGRYRSADLARGELGFRTQLASGAELTLVREPLGYWYADDTPSPSSPPTTTPGATGPR